jgi:hypothetical protein
MNAPPDSVPPPVWEYARAVAASLAGASDGALVGLYLHGSGAMGGWHPERSDVDLLGVVSRSLRPDEKRGAAEALAALPAPGAGLELSIVTEASLKSVPERPRFELHVTTGSDAKVVDGERHRGDSDLVMHYAVCRERGVAVLGPPAAEVFPPVPRAMLLASFIEEVAWGLEHAPMPPAGHGHSPRALVCFRRWRALSGRSHAAPASSPARPMLSTPPSPPRPAAKNPRRLSKR